MFADSLEILPDNPAFFGVEASYWIFQQFFA
jgi:hypothetical protein